MNSSIELTKELKNIFNNLKSDYFLQLLFNNLVKKRYLDIIKYNNNIRDRINISIKDYKEYSEIYSLIEIKIKPVNNIYDKFIILIKKKMNTIIIYSLIIIKKK